MVIHFTDGTKVSFDYPQQVAAMEINIENRTFIDFPVIAVLYISVIHSVTNLSQG